MQHPRPCMFKVILTGYGFWNLDYFVISFHHSVWAEASKTTTPLPSSMCLPFIRYSSLLLHTLALNYMGLTKVCTLVKQILKQNKAGDELSDANPLHHQMINPNHYNRLLLSDTEQACISSETHSVPGKVPLMVQSAYPTEVDFIQDFCNILAVILCIFYCYEHLSSYGVMLCNYGLSCCNISIWVDFKEWFYLQHALSVTMLQLRHHIM